MVDLHPVFEQLLQPIAHVELQFPDADSLYPMITVSQLDTSAEAVLDGAERLSQQDWQLDIWDDGNTPQKVMSLADRVNNVLVSHGIRRYFGRLMRDPSGKQRFCMRVRFVLDELTGQVYTK